MYYTKIQIYAFECITKKLFIIVVGFGYEIEAENIKSKFKLI